MAGTTPSLISCPRPPGRRGIAARCDPRARDGDPVATGNGWAVIVDGILGGDDEGASSDATPCWISSIRPHRSLDRLLRWSPGAADTKPERGCITPDDDERRRSDESGRIDQEAACPDGVTTSHRPPNSVTSWQVTTFLPSWA